MSKSTVFISYSHKDEKLKDRLVSHLGVLQQEGLLEVWEDRRIGAGKDWEPEIEAALKQARVAILLISDHFLNSKFILTKEVPALMQRRISDGLHVVPVILSDCPWQKVSWLSPIQSRPRDGRAVTSFTGNKRNQELSKIAIEISSLLNNSSDTTNALNNLQSPISNFQSPISNPPTISIARLPQLLTRDLFGRDAELQRLDDAWANPRTNVIVFVAFGGSGKSALVNRWMQRMAEENYRGAERVYAWSFWSQGSDQAQTSADPFIDAALRWFGDPDPTAGSPWEKGERLAQLIRKTRTLLILDGLEPLQHPRVPMEGRLKEQSMQALLGELAGSQPGLCIVSTREHIADLHGFAPPAVISHDLDQLSPQAGAQILREQKIAGEADELEQAARDFGCHALALTILGSLLKNAYDGDIRRRKELAPLTKDEQNGGHARRVMTSYETWLSAAGEQSMLAVLRLLGLFNRPADAHSLAALRAAPVIPGMTDGLQHLKEHEWRQTVAKLRRFKLLAESGAGVATDFSLSPAPGQTGGQTKVRPTDELDAHALVREHFGQQMKRDYPGAWRAANLRLYEYLTTTTKELPDTVEEMSPLFAAVAHGCEADRHQQALDDVYWRRIRRGEEAFSIHKLGAFGAELAALAGFFETPWQQSVPELTEYYQAFVMNEAGFCLRALGRLQEAAEPMQAGLQTYISQEKWMHAAIVASNLSELYLTIGDPPPAIKVARQSVELADRSDNEFWRMFNMTTLADALYQAGQPEEAATAFRQAEEMQKQRQSTYPILYSVQGFRYCDLLLGQGKHQEVKERAVQGIEVATRNHWLLDIALDNLSLGRACLLQSRQSGAGDYRQAAEFLQQAVDGLRQAGTMHYLPLGLLARAELRRVTGDYPRSRADLDEAQRIAERSQMGLHLADCHLERARLCLALGESDSARKAWATAKAMIERMGYHRRDAEVAEIGAALETLSAE